MNPKKSGNDFSVVLEKTGNQPLLTMKTLMQITGIGLSDAKKMVDSTPITVVSGLDGKKARKLKEQLEAIGNVVSVPGMESEAVTETPAVEKKNTAKASVKKDKPKEKAEKHAPSELECALAKAYDIVGRDGFENGERVCNLLGDLVPKLEKERRRIKIAYSANAVAVLINEADKTFAVSEAVKRMVDYSDMAESVAKETILAIYEVLK